MLQKRSLLWLRHNSCTWGCRLTALYLFVTAIHQRRHALLHPDQDERQWERRRERTNPHPRLPQNCSDAALYEPHRQHGTGCLRHVIITWLCWRRGIGRVGQKKKKSTRLKWPQKTWLSGLTPLSWLSMRPTRIRLNLLPKCTLKILLTNWEKDLQHFFLLLNKWMFEEDIGKKNRRENVLQ